MPGVPAQTGVGTLFVILTDVNDNAPQFAEDYRPVVYENQPSGHRVVEVSAVDRDTALNGPLFEMWIPCSGGCPCSDNPACQHFSFRYKPGRWSWLVYELRSNSFRPFHLDFILAIHLIHFDFILAPILNHQ